jgi:hypothetical protein
MISISTMILLTILINKNMILTKEHQQQMVNSYLKTHTVSETESYIKGIEAIIKLINKQTK